MPVKNREGPTALDAYAEVSIAIEVDRVLEPANGPGDPNLPRLIERRLRTPYLKNYDGYAGNHPRDWGRRFDLSNWGFMTAWLEERRVGGAVIACRTPGLQLLEGRSDLALLWDLRVVPEFRGDGIGTKLFRAAEAWSATRDCGRIKIETQNTNAGACRFYASQGCKLGAVNRSVYAELPDEIQLLWYKDLTPRG
jgi:GNAT superfamily N-acetyltransferase